MLEIPVNYSEESHHDSLVRNTSLQLCMGILNHMGFRGEYQPRSFGSKFAMLALNARNVVILITIASNTPINIREKLSPLDENGRCPPLLPPPSFGMHFLASLAQAVFYVSLFTDTKPQKSSTPSQAAPNGPSTSSLGSATASSRSWMTRNSWSFSCRRASAR